MDLWSLDLCSYGVQFVILGLQTYPGTPFAAAMHPSILPSSPCGKVWTRRRIAGAKGAIWDRAKIDHTRKTLQRTVSHCPLLSSRHCLACIPVCSNTSVWYFHWAESQAGPEDTTCTLLWMDATICGDLCQSLCFRVNVCAHVSVCVSERKKRDKLLVAQCDSLSQSN